MGRRWVLVGAFGTTSVGHVRVEMVWALHHRVGARAGRLLADPWEAIPMEELAYARVDRSWMTLRAYVRDPLDAGEIAEVIALTWDRNSINSLYNLLLA